MVRMVSLAQAAHGEGAARADPQLNLRARQPYDANKPHSGTPSPPLGPAGAGARRADCRADLRMRAASR